MTQVDEQVFEREFEFGSRKVNLSFDLSRYAEFKNQMVFSFEDESFFIFILGIVYSLKNQSNFNEEDIKNCLYELEDGIFHELDGNFNLIYFDKLSRKFSAFTDRSSLFAVYYQADSEVFKLSNRIDLIYEANSHHTFDEIAIRRFISSGYYLTNDTILQGVKKLTAGCRLILNEKDYLIKPYFEYVISQEKADLSDLIYECDNLFRSAVEKHFYFCQQNSLSVGAFLSGGMDSRLTSATLFTHLKDLSVYNFGDKGQFDCAIAKLISQEMNWNYTHLPFFIDNIIEKFKEVVMRTEGRTSFENHIRLIDSLDTLARNEQSPRSIFTGQVGATVGALTFSSARQPFQMLNAQYFPEVNHDYGDQYQSLEELMVYNLSFNGSTVGENLNYKFALPFSPFLEAKFIDFTKKIPLRAKIRRQFYLKWAIEKYPKMAVFPWSQTGLNLKNSLFLRQRHRAISSKIRYRILFQYGKRRKQKFSQKKSDFTEIITEYFRKREMTKRIQTMLSSELCNDFNEFLSKGSIQVKSRTLTVMGYIEHLENFKNEK